MLARKIISLVASFQSKDWRNLERWLASPIHNTDEGLSGLGGYFRGIAPKFDVNTLSKALLWRAAYADKPLNEGVLRVKIRQLTIQIEDFLAWQKFKEDEALQSRLLLKARASNLNFESYEQATLKLVQKLETSGRKGIIHFYEKLQLESDLIAHPEFDNYRSNGKYLQQTNESLDAFFTLFKYRLGCEIKNRERIRGGAYTLRFWETLEVEQQNGFMEGNPTVGLYNNLFKVLSTPADYSLVEDLKEAMLLDYKALLPRDLNNVYYSTLNHLSRMINRGGSEYYPRTLAWYRLGLETDILLVDGKISHITFNNIALLGYQGGEYAWTENFLEEFNPFLKEEQREDALSACRGMGAFYQQDYQRAIDILANHSFGPAYELRQRLTIIRAYYELLLAGGDVYEKLARRLSNFNGFLTRNTTFSEVACEPYKNHLRILRQLVDRKLREDYSRETKAVLVGEINGSEQLVAKQWLLAKI